MNSKMKIKRIGILTGGGDCPGLNAVIRAVVKNAIFQYELEVIGFLEGYLGMIKNMTRRLESSGCLRNSASRGDDPGNVQPR